MNASNHTLSPVDRAQASPSHALDDGAILQTIVEGTVRNTGADFFKSLVRHLARAIDAQYGFVAGVAALLDRTVSTR